jgi:hypothetical protein
LQKAAALLMIVHFLQVQTAGHIPALVMCVRGSRWYRTPWHQHTWLQVSEAMQAASQLQCIAVPSPTYIYIYIYIFIYSYKYAKL